MDPPRHTKLRALISKAFTPRVVANLEPRIKQLSRELLDEYIERGEMDLATQYSVPLPMKVIAELIGIPIDDWSRFRHWSDVILKLSYVVRGISDPQEAAKIGAEIAPVMDEIRSYLPALVEQKKIDPKAHCHLPGADCLKHHRKESTSCLSVNGQKTCPKSTQETNLIFSEYF